MSTRSCCAVPGRSSFISSRGGADAKGAARLGTPALILILLPKCPMCVAAYVAMFTGIGLSMEAATWLQETTIAVCVLAIILAITRMMRRHPVSGSSSFL
jgi:type III secretory pathway component EscS